VRDEVTDEPAHYRVILEGGHDPTFGVARACRTVQDRIRRFHVVDAAPVITHLIAAR